MCDGELILENSPLHQYLQEIGWDDTQIIARATAPQEKPKQTVSLLNFLRSTKSLVEALVSRVYSYVFLLHSTCWSLNVADLRNQAGPYLLAQHKDSLEHLINSVVIGDPSPNTSSLKLIIFNPTIFYSVVFSLSVLSGLMTGFSNALLNTVIVVISACSVCLYWTNHQRNSPSDIISQYVDSVRTYKQLGKVMLSYLRDCQIARTPYATGVTWSKLDNIEKQCSEGLQSAEMRMKLLDSVQLVYQMHKRAVEEWLSRAALISEIDCVNRYICMQEDQDILSEDEEIRSDIRLSSQMLRYNLKLVEHVSSEVLWRLIVSTFPLAWPGGQINNRKIHEMLRSLNDLQQLVCEQEVEMRGYYEKHNNPAIESAVLAPAAPSDTNASHVLHQLQLLHSSLNIATIRCRDAHSIASQNKASDLSSTLSLIKLNVDLADATLQTLTSLTAASAPPHAPLHHAATEQTLEEGDEAVPIVPYKQQGNMVFSGVNDGTDSESLLVGGLDSDDELDLNLHRHKEESKLMLAELKHVIETNPTCLYEDDYEDFKKTGLLNPTKCELKELYENNSEEGSDTELTATSPPVQPRIGFNPSSLPFPSHPFSSASPFSTACFPSSLYSEMEVCEAYGDLSDEEEEEEMKRESDEPEDEKIQRESDKEEGEKMKSESDEKEGGEMKREFGEEKGKEMTREERVIIGGIGGEMKGVGVEKAEKEREVLEKEDHL